MVQRIPLRVCFDADQDLSGLRAGMSSDVAVDTGRTRSLEGLKQSLIGWGRSWIEPTKANAAGR